jgi:hypothetical protein
MFVTYNENVILFVVYKHVLVTNIAHYVMKLINEPKLVINNAVVKCWCVDVTWMTSNWKTYAKQ